LQKKLNNKNTMQNFDFDAHIAKKEAEIQKHREFLDHLETLQVRDDIRLYILSFVSSKIAGCEISINQHRKRKEQNEKSI